MWLLVFCALIDCLDKNIYPIECIIYSLGGGNGIIVNGRCMGAVNQ